MTEERTRLAEEGPSEITQLTADEAGSDVNVDYDVENADGDLNDIQLILEKNNGEDLERQTVYDGTGTNQESRSYTFADAENNAKQVQLFATDAEGNEVDDIDGSNSTTVELSIDKPL